MEQSGKANSPSITPFADNNYLVKAIEKICNETGLKINVM